MKWVSFSINTKSLAVRHNMKYKESGPKQDQVFLRINNYDSNMVIVVKFCMSKNTLEILFLDITCMLNHRVG